MKFLALLKKELRECLPWLLLAAILFLFISTMFVRSSQFHRQQFNFWQRPENDSFSHWFLMDPSTFLHDAGKFLLVLSIGLGLVLGARQFLLPWLLKTWSFTLHRSISREQILAAKLAAAAITFIASLGLIWTALFWYASRPGILPIPLRPALYAIGWIYILCGFLFYLGTALVGLTKAKWYTTRTFGLGFAILIFWWAAIQWQIPWCLAILAAGMFLLAVQLTHTFLTREF